MQLISVDDLINHKVLPFDLYVSKGKKIFSAGEVLTPGKILQLKYIPEIYIEEVEEDKNFPEIEEGQEELDILNELEGLSPEDDESENIESPPQKPKFLSEYYSTNTLEKVKTSIKDKYSEMMETFTCEGIKDAGLCIDIRDNIIEEIIPEVSRIFFKSQVKVYGDFNTSHGINVAIFSALLAHKMKFNDQLIKDITLAAMLHDIGKTEIPDSVLNKSTLTQNEQRLVQLHTKLGYNIIRNELGLSENIAKVALQHHERPDGSGYPYGLSGKLISTEAYIVAICDEFDRLTSGRGSVKVKNYKEAMRYLLDTGSRHFRSDVLYTFIHMTNYNDMTPIAADLYTK